MKALVVLAMTIFASGASAQNGAPEYCRGEEACVVGRNLFSYGHYYARGNAESCSEAIQDALEVFERSHGNLANCGRLHRSPFSIGCADGPGGVTAVVKCSPVRNRRRHSTRPRCANVGGRIVC
jgi:hypothetical protein